MGLGGKQARGKDTCGRSDFDANCDPLGSGRPIDCSSAYKKAIRTHDDPVPCRSESEGAASGCADDDIRSPRMA